MKMKNLPILKRSIIAGFVTLASLPLTHTASYAQAIPCLNTSANASHYNYSIDNNYFNDIGQDGSVSVGSISFDSYFEYTVSINILYQTGSNLGAPQVNSYAIQLPFRSKIVGITDFGGYKLLTLISHKNNTMVPLYLILKCTEFNQPPYIEKCFSLDNNNTPYGMYPQHTVTDGQSIYTTGYYLDNTYTLSPKPQDDKSAFVLKFDYSNGNIICRLHNTPKVSTGGFNNADIPDYDNGMRLQLNQEALLVTATANGKSSADVGGYIDAINSSYARNLILKKSTLDIAEDNSFGYSYSGTVNPTNFNGLVNVDLSRYKDYAYINLLTAYRDGKLAMPALAALDNGTLKLMASSNNGLEIKTGPYVYNTKTQPMNIHNIGTLSTTFSVTGIRSMTDDKDYVPFTFAMDLDVSNGELYQASSLYFNYTPNAAGCAPFFSFSDNRLNPNIPLWTNPYSSVLPTTGGDLLQMDLLKFQGNNKDARFIYQKYTGNHYCENPLSADANSVSYETQYIPVQEQNINLTAISYPATTSVYPVQITSCNVNPNIYAKMLQTAAAFSIKEVYPNPSSNGDFTLNLSDNSDQFHIRITNIIGQVVMEKDLTGFTHQLHIASSGLYLIEVTNAAGAKEQTRISIK